MMPPPSVLEKIGHTPLLRLKKALPASFSPKVEVYAKAEWFNPGGSVKDRPALKMIEAGRASGKFKKDQTLIDSSSGNTGIAYAMIGAALGFPVELVMPKNVSLERKKIIEGYGAKIIESDPLQGSDGARQLVRQRAARNPERYFFPDQYSNPANAQAHYETTGPEIWEQTRGRITHFASGLGTSGTLMGVSRFLKERNPKIFSLAVQPEAFHGIEGLKNMEAALPVPIYDAGLHDQKLTVPTEPAYEWTRELARKEGLSVGPSSGAVLYGMLAALKDLKSGLVVMIFPDSGDKYLSTGLGL